MNRFKTVEDVKNKISELKSMTKSKRKTMLMNGILSNMNISGKVSDKQIRSIISIEVDLKRLLNEPLTTRE